MTIKKNTVRGRPIIPEKQKRTAIVQFRCTEAEKKQLERLAKKSGHKLSDWLREQALAS